MSVNILFAADQADWPDYEIPLREALTTEGLEFDLRTTFDPQVVDYIVYAPSSDVQDFTPYTRLKAVLNLWAGVEGVAGNQTLNVPLARMVDHGLTQGMVEWVTGHVLRHHLGMDAHIVNPAHEWALGAPPLAEDRPVTILGYGALGTACGEALRTLGFPVTGWSRRPGDTPGINRLHGSDGFTKALETAAILVLLLPLTIDTENLIDADALARLPKGAVIINPGRGGLIDDAALIAALDEGHISHATLDVFRVEPLPADDPYWAHPKVTVTPHIASETRPKTAARTIAQNIRRAEDGLPLNHLVDRDRGY
ncbi:glyoxylate/hydroxypyruvate reductase A [Primorskyibacter sedentarius]|uniref:Glyoxylate/hydroxypyruvate reductase A n=1 Tax=Primorskyibacter sedentarius TaxID=745311 RepID=A0A4R3JQC9_9RHOB|nr:glyoxylate/hydroxypyruvate reductase A [Primorskyibacter sedentarius]TCS67615.1 glyoxylate/hydroxypyruvate reductase A [Primorskyibacter sedentarius]